MSPVSLERGAVLLVSPNSQIWFPFGQHWSSYIYAQACIYMLHNMLHSRTANLIKSLTVYIDTSDYADNVTRQRHKHFNSFAFASASTWKDCLLQVGLTFCSQALILQPCLCATWLAKIGADQQRVQALKSIQLGFQLLTDSNDET